MAKGLFTQGMCVLLSGPVTAEQVRDRLDSAFSCLGAQDVSSEPDSPTTLVYDFRGEIGGHLLVTLSDSAWPDDLGDPDETPERFIGWSLGQFGPLAYPGCLDRAAKQSPLEEQPDVAIEHRAHVRLLISYVLGVETEDDDGDDTEEMPLIPDDYDAIEELQFLTKAVTQLLEMPEALCYFNPGGEVLRDENGLRRGLNQAWIHELPPLDMWTNVRLFQATDNWSLMDTVGNAQFDVPDQEAVFDPTKFEASEVEGFLRGATLYLLQNSEDVQDGDESDGPGQLTWEAIECVEGLSDPPRETIRWIPQNGCEPPSELTFRGETSEWDEDEVDDEDDGDDDLGDGNLFGSDDDDEDVREG